MSTTAHGHHCAPTSMLFKEIVRLETSVTKQPTSGGVVESIANSPFGRVVLFRGSAPSKLQACTGYLPYSVESFSTGTGLFGLPVASMLPNLCVWARVWHAQECHAYCMENLEPEPSHSCRYYEDLAKACNLSAL